MRIVIFGWAQSTHVQRWATGLHERGYQIKVISLGGERIDGVETRVFPYGNKLAYLARAYQAARNARAFKPDLIHVHYAGGFGLWGLMTKVMPTVVSVWGADIMESAENPVIKALVRLTLRRATWVSATSNFLADVCTTLAPDTKSKLSVIPFGVVIPPVISPLPNDDPVRICFLKSHRPKYGPDLLIKAMGIACKVVPGLTLSLAGQGEMTKQLKRLVHLRGLDEQILFPGHIAPEKVYEFIGKHHFMVMPSVLDSESFGVAAIEAGACGRAVIASRVGGVPEVILNGRTGLLVPPNDVDALASAITTLARDSETRNAMGQAGYEYVRDNYSWNKSLDMMTALYERLFDEHKKKNPAV